MIVCKEIVEYLEYVEAHPNWINEERKLLIENIVKPTLARDDVFFDEKTFQNCIKYCEKHYYKLFPYQKFIYAFVFMYKDGDPLFSKFIIIMGRGNGKDGFIVPLVNFLQTPLYGVKNYHIEIVANCEEQAKDTFMVAYEATKDMKGKFSVTKELITNVVTGSFMRYNTANAGTKDGKKPGALILNEIHAYENYDQINVFESAFGKVGGEREFIISTNGYVREGPYDDTIDVCMEILKTGENPLEYFPFICRIKDKSQIDDMEAWHLANPSMEYRPTLAKRILKDYLEMKKFPSKRAEFVTKRMNYDDRDDEDTVAKWDDIKHCCYDDIEKKTPRTTQDTSGRSAILSIDYADVRDFASVGRLTEAGGEYIWRQHTWICEQSPTFSSIKFPILTNMGLEEFQDYEVVTEKLIPPEAIVQWCLEQMEAYDVVKITMDVYRYQLFRVLFEEAGLQVESRQNPDGQIRLIRKPGSVCGLIAPEIEKLFIEHKINYGMSAIMRWYTNNTKIRRDKDGNMHYEKIEPKLRKNDGFMAFLMAMYSKDLIKERVIYV